MTSVSKHAVFWLTISATLFFVDSAKAQQSSYSYDPSGNLTAITGTSSVAPSIITQPQSGLLYSNNSISFSVTATGAGVSYQWLSNGVPVLGATNDTLFLSNLATTNGNFSVIISNSFGSVTSAPAAIWADSNGNRIPDWWEMKYFGNLNQTADGDYDGDGVNNLDEYREGTDPTNPNSYNPRLHLQASLGSVLASPAQPYYTLGQTVTLTAIPNPGQMFLGWSGSASGGASTISVVMHTNYTVNANFGLPLPVALDNTTLTWTTGGDAPWFGQTQVSENGLGAAQSGPIVGGQQSWLQAINTNSTQAFQLSFWWSVSSQSPDALTFSVDGNISNSITGPTASWQEVVVNLPQGNHTLVWAYAKQSNGNPFGVPFADSGWVDEVAVIPIATAPIIVVQPSSQLILPGSNATFYTIAYGSPPLNYQWQFNGSNLTNNSQITGSQSNALTLTSVTTNNSGTYRVVVTNTFGSTNADATLVVRRLSPPVINYVYPPAINELAGDHVAYQTSVIGTGIINYQWYHTNNLLGGQTNSILVLTDIQAADSGKYEIAVVDNSGIYVTNSVTLNVATTSLPFYPTNLVVVRIGDGVQTLSGAGGNTIYLDQYSATGVYVSSLMVPDESVGTAYGIGSAVSVSGSPALLLPGSGNDYIYSGMLTLSPNQQFLSFAGYCANYPFVGGDITVDGESYSRGLATVNASGSYNLAYTNVGLYSAGNHSIRSTVTLDGTNFWTTGQAGQGGVKYVNTRNTIYNGGNGIPSISPSSAIGPRMVQVFGTNLVYSDASAGAGSGLYICSGTPEPLAGGVATATLLLNEGGQPNDFAISPDARTIYIADSQTFTNTTTKGGGVQRWDTNSAGGGYVFSYTLPVNQFSGAQALTVSFPANITHWGSNVFGATLFATGPSNVLCRVFDNGLSSTATILVNTAPYNELLRGVRFAPSGTNQITAPVIQTVRQTGNSFTFAWSAIANQAYQVQSTASLAPVNWTNSGGSITATNSIMTTFEPIATNSQQFYRIILVP